MDAQQLQFLNGLIGLTAGLNRLLTGIRDAYSDGHLSSAEATKIILTALEAGINQAAERNAGNVRN